MLNQKTYSCGICKTTPDQISHHKSHLDTQKHKDKRELFEFKLSKLTDAELEKSYKTTNINDIIVETETIIYTPIDKANLLINNKKLKQKIINNVDYIKPEQMSDTQKELKNKLETEMESVSNKEALKDKIHEIHNYLRNNGAGYGMNALKVFNILYGLKKIEENGLLDKVNLKKPDCEFSYLLKFANENRDEELADLIFGNVLQSICDSKLKELLFYEIPQNIRGSVFSYLIKEIDKITIIEKTCNVLLSGKIYEYFIGRDETAISELGAYFTDRHIVEYILSKLNPSINPDGTISSMIDMFGGSGGFTTGYINYLNEKYPQLINWSTEINKISHFDINEDVIKSAGLEFFCLTGVLPNMNNLKYKNSFTDEFNGQKYKYPLTNPPYGGDKKKKTEGQSRREKVKEFIKNELSTITDEGLRITRQKQLKKIEAEEKQEKKENDKAKVSVSMCSARIQKFAKDHELKGNDKETCSLMLLMDILEVGGTAIGVLKQGVFFDKTYKDLRKCLIENFNVREIISIPQDQFENTTTKTSIVIFDNTEEKTTEVKFSDLFVERYTEDKFAEVFGDIVIIENKDDIKRVSDKVVSLASKHEILENAICSFNAKEYHKKKINVGHEYELVKLGSICKCLTTTKHCTNIGKLEGKYKFYNSSQDSKLYVDFCEVTDYSIILGQGGNFNIHIDKNFTASKHVCVIQLNNNNELLLQFIYYIIPELQKTFITNGSTISWLNKTNIRDFNIPIPKSPCKIKEWVDKISLPYNEKNMKQIQIKELETFIQNRIVEIGENEECDELELGSVLTRCKTGKTNTTSITNTGEYPFYSATASNPVSTHNSYDFDSDSDNYYLLFAKSGGNSKTICGESLGIGKFWLVKGKTAANVAMIRFNIKPGFNVNYVNNYLKSILRDIQKSALYTTGNGNINVDDMLKKFKIKIPKNKQFILNLEERFKQLEILENEVKSADELYKKRIHELSQEAIPKQQNTITEEPQIPQEAINEFIEEIEIVVPKKKVVKKTKSKQVIIENKEETH
jgi:type I restriction-modification system DNA methylase subunit